jgi:hypothetical protein
MTRPDKRAARFGPHTWLAITQRTKFTPTPEQADRLRDLATAAGVPLWDLFKALSTFDGRHYWALPDEWPPSRHSELRADYAHVRLGRR